MEISDLVIIMLLCILIIYAYNILNKKCLIEKMDNIKRIVVILKTHIWNNKMEEFANKILNETKRDNIDFIILMHAENKKEFNKIKNHDLKKRTVTFKENDIKSMYRERFYSMWLSNHWILMWFYKFNKQKYDYFWTIEYDVRISGDSSRIWNYSGNEDFVYPIKPFQHQNWIWRNHYVPGKCNKQIYDNKYYGYLQLTRYSNRFLKYLDEQFTCGENGQDELILFTLFKRSNYSGNHHFLNSLIHDSWSVVNSDSDKHKKLFEISEKKYLKNKNHLQIFHPIKY